MTTYLTEKDALREVLYMYKNMPCLWNPTHEHYLNKVERQKAHTALLNLYRRYEPSYTLNMLKKKIENMRTTSKREYKKVLKAKMENEERTPTLWYYNEISFLNSLNGSSPSHNDSQLEQSFSSNTDKSITKIEENEEEVDDEDMRSNDKFSTVYLEEEVLENHNQIEEREDNNSSMSKNQIEMTNDNRSVTTTNPNEAESFGRTVGLQLSELSSDQRYIAEKLISEVIFYARLNKLDYNTSISLGSGSKKR